MQNYTYTYMVGYNQQGLTLTDMYVHIPYYVMNSSQRILHGLTVSHRCTCIPYCVGGKMNTEFAYVYTTKNNHTYTQYMDVGVY